MGFLLWSVVGAAMGFVAARRHGFSRTRGVVGGLLLGPLAVVLFFAARPVVHDMRRRKCPYCADWVEVNARVCTYCNAILIDGSRSRG